MWYQNTDLNNLHIGKVLKISMFPCVRFVKKNYFVYTFTVIGLDRDDLTRNELRLHLVVNGVTDR